MNIEINEVLLAEPNLVQIEMADRIFLKSYRYFKVCNTIAMLYTFAKIFATPVFAYMATDERQLCTWLIVLSVISVLQMIHYVKVHKTTNDVNMYIKLAQDLNHMGFVNKPEGDANLPETIESRTHETIDFTNLQQLQIDERKTKVLSLQIKYNMQKHNKFLFYSGKIHFALYQVVHLWGFIVLFSIDSDSTASIYLKVVLFLGTYQYLEFYILLILIVLIAPFVLIWQLTKAIIARKNKAKALKTLVEKAYDQGLEGDHECKICLGEYEMGDRLVSLKCSPMHHFHANCIRSWVEVSPNCPVCRSDINQ